MKLFWLCFHSNHFVEDLCGMSIFLNKTSFSFYQTVQNLWSFSLTTFEHITQKTLSVSIMTPLIGFTSTTGFKVQFC